MNTSDSSFAIRQQASRDFFTLLQQKGESVSDAELQPIIDRFIEAGDDPAKVKAWLTFLRTQKILPPSMIAGPSSTVKVADRPIVVPPPTRVPAFPSGPALISPPKPPAVLFPPETTEAPQ